MPVSFLTEEQERRYGRYAGEPSPEQLARFFHLDDADREVIDRRRSDHMRLGFALQLCTARFVGTFLNDPAEAPFCAVAALARQLGVTDPLSLARYAASERRYDHTAEIRSRYGYRNFSDFAAQWRLLRWLYALCWTGTDRPAALFDQATAWLVAHKVLLPGASVLERTVARVRSRANSRLWRLLAARITPEQKARLSKVCALVLDNAVGDADLRAAVFAAVAQAALEAAVAQVGSLTRPPDDPYFDELLAQHRRIRRFLPHFLRVVGLGTMPAGRPVLKALHHLRTVEDGSARGTPWPTEFVPKSWERRVTRNGIVDRRAWTLCLVDRLRGALRRRDVFAAPSLRFADPRIGLLDGAAWEAARPTVCRTLGKSQNAAEEISRLTERLDQAFRTVADNLPRNAGVRIEQNGADEDLVLTGLDRLAEPASLVALRNAITTRLPRVDLPELLLEIDARTGFAGAFTHASEAEARARGLRTTLCAVLLAEACNTGLEPLVRPDLPALRRSRLSWVRQNYLRTETLTQANAGLVAAQNAIDLARRWGGGDVASADGLRFVVPVRTLHAGPNPKYFGSERGVTYYNLVSDQFTGLNAITVPGTLRDSLVLLSVVLEQETELEPTEIMTDTGAYTDVIFGIFWLLGYQFSPRIADVGGARFWRADPTADYGSLDKLASHKVRTGLIAEHWDDLLRLAGSLKLGLVQAGGLMRTLQTNDRPTRLARALEELGRIIKTLYLLAYIDDEAYRRRILTQLNRGEGRHQLARAVFHGKRGELRQRYREGQEDQLGALGLVVNAIILWNTIYMDAALDQLRVEGFDVRDEDVARLSPLAHEHINMLGRYAFTLPEPVARGELRPLRNPAALVDEDV